MKADSNHIDEHTLTRFALNDDALKTEREEMVRHLAVCDGCRALFDEIQSFYLHAEKETEHNQSLGKRHKQELVKQQALPSVWTEPISRIIPKFEISLPSKIWYIVKQRPVAYSGGLFIAIAALFFIVSNVTRSSKDDNPSYYTFEHHVLSIHNAQDDVLWKKPLNDSHRNSEYDEASKKTIALIDVDLDGKNEVVTIFGVKNESESLKNSVTMYNHDGSVLWRKNLGREVIYQGKKYNNDFFTRKMLLHEYHGRKCIFIIIANAHSPSAIIVLDLYGNIQGEYWNYGHISDFVFADVDKDTHDELVLSALLDDQNNPAVIALDYQNIIDIQQSQFSAFDAMGFSDAEEYGALVNVTAKFTSGRDSFLEIRTNEEGKIRTLFGSSPVWHFSILFGGNLQCDEVLPTDSAIEKYGMEGALKVAEELKNSLKYWQKTKVKPPV